VRQIGVSVQHQCERISHDSRCGAQFDRFHEHVRVMACGVTPLAWMLWSVAHVYFLIGFRNRFVVALNWAWSYITFQRGSRLITGRSILPNF